MQAYIYIYLFHMTLDANVLADNPAMILNSFQLSVAETSSEKHRTCPTALEG
jgi:hypothetical protein